MSVKNCFISGCQEKATKEVKYKGQKQPVCPKHRDALLNQR